MLSIPIQIPSLLLIDRYALQYIAIIVLHRTACIPYYYFFFKKTPFPFLEVQLLAPTPHLRFLLPNPATSINETTRDSKPRRRACSDARLKIGQKREREREGAYEPIRLLNSKTGKKGCCYGRKSSLWCLMVLVSMVEAMNVVGDSKRERIVESRLVNIEENQNRNVKGVSSKKKNGENGFIQSWIES